jgi:hypothetical protein
MVTFGERLLPYELRHDQAFQGERARPVQKTSAALSAKDSYFRAGSIPQALIRRRTMLHGSGGERAPPIHAF